MPLFIYNGASPLKEEVQSMPGCFRHSLASMLQEVEESMSYGVKSFILFPKIEDSLKSNLGEEASNPDGLVPRAIRMIKEKFPSAVVYTDVALV